MSCVSTPAGALVKFGSAIAARASASLISTALAALVSGNPAGLGSGAALIAGICPRAGRAKNPARAKAARSMPRSQLMLQSFAVQALMASERRQGYVAPTELDGASGPIVRINMALRGLRSGCERP